MNEIWKDIEWYNWIYHISSKWMVHSIKSWNYLRWSNSNWYISIKLEKEWKFKNFGIHRLVAIAFITNPENKPQVNHIDWNKQNNSVDNLEWCTVSENQVHSRQILNNVWWREKKIIIQHSKDWEFIREWDSMVDVTKKIWIYFQNISSCCRWKAKSAGWYVWRFK